MNLDDLMRQDTGRRITRIDDIPALSAIAPQQRAVMWAGLGLVPTVERLSRILADLDLATIGTGTADPSIPVVTSFLAGIAPQAREQARCQLERGNEVLHPIPLLFAIKEVVEFADPESAETTSDDELFAVLLTISA